jgi:hypothetical protein
MLSRSVIILFYFCFDAYETVNQFVTRGTPGEGHPLKEGLRPVPVCLHICGQTFPERVIH